MLLLRLFTIFYFLSFFGYLSTKTPTQEIQVVVGEGFITHINVPLNIEKTECWYYFESEEKQKVPSKPNESHRRKTGEIITSYSNSFCGIRVNNLSDNVTGTWTLEVIMVNGTVFDLQILLTVTNRPETNFETKIQAPIGSKEISCSDRSLRRSCRIRNLNNEIISDECSVSQTIKNVEIFFCRTLHWGTMLESEEIITVNLKDKYELTESQLIDNEEHMQLICQFPQKVSSCRAEYPNSKSQIYIRDGFSSEHFSSFDTNVDSGKCVLEIRKPLSSEYYGIWRIYSAETKSESGCIFYLTSKTNEKLQLIEAEMQKIKKNTEVNLVANKGYGEFSLTCQVPFKLDSCYLRDPENRLIFVDELSFARDRTVGKCTFKNLDQLKGEWICGMSGSDYHSEVLQKFNVVLHSMHGQVFEKNIRIKTGEYSIMMCRSALEEPISQCGFTDPKGRVYMLSDKFPHDNSKRINYFGKGLSQGDCGIKIDEIHNDEFGHWSCFFKAEFGSPSSFDIEIISANLSASIKVQLSILIFSILLSIQSIFN